MSEHTEELTGTILEVFIPGPGENPEDPNDMERTLFLGAAQEALDSGVDIEVYSTDSYPSAFEECEPVAEQNCDERYRRSTDYARQRRGQSFVYVPDRRADYALLESPQG